MAVLSASRCRHGPIQARQSAPWQHSPTALRPKPPWAWRSESVKRNREAPEAKPGWQLDGYDRGFSIADAWLL
jgi:hypothetical protein